MDSSKNWIFAAAASVLVFVFGWYCLRTVSDIRVVLCGAEIGTDAEACRSIGTALTGLWAINVIATLGSFVGIQWFLGFLQRAR